MTHADALSERMGVCPPDRRADHDAAQFQGREPERWERLVAAPVPFSIVPHHNRALRRRDD